MSSLVKKCWKSIPHNQQTNELIARLSPTPTPFWIVASPYTSIYPPTTTTSTSAGA